jgi:hypothetical protein
MGCQRDIAEKILEKKADYVLALKAIKARFARMSRRSPAEARSKLTAAINTCWHDSLIIFMSMICVRSV